MGVVGAGLGWAELPYQCMCRRPACQPAGPPTCQSASPDTCHALPPSPPSIPPSPLQPRTDRASKIDYFDYFLTLKPSGTIDESFVRFLTPMRDVGINSGIYTFDVVKDGKPEKVGGRVAGWLEGCVCCAVAGAGHVSAAAEHCSEGVGGQEVLVAGHGARRRVHRRRWHSLRVLASALGVACPGATPALVHCSARTRSRSLHRRTAAGLILRSSLLLRLASGPSSAAAGPGPLHLRVPQD